MGVSLLELQIARHVPILPTGEQAVCAQESEDGITWFMTLAGTIDVQPCAHGAGERSR